MFFYTAELFEAYCKPSVCIEHYAPNHILPNVLSLLTLNFLLLQTISVTQNIKCICHKVSIKYFGEKMILLLQPALKDFTNSKVLFY